MEQQEIQSVKAKYTENDIQNKLTDANLLKLIEIANERLKALVSNGSASAKCKRFPTETGNDVRILCDSHYFENREAYTFYANGEVSIAHWASGMVLNVFNTAFDEWC